MVNPLPRGDLSAHRVCRTSHCRYHRGMSPRPKKQRLTVTVDPDLIDAGQRAVQSGKAASVSGWVSDALADKVRRDQRLALLATAIADYEDEFGEITAEEIASQRRADRHDATVVRGQPQRARRRASTT